MKSLKNAIIPVLSLAALVSLTACGGSAKSQKFLLESERIAYVRGTQEDLSRFDSIGLDTEEKIKNYVKNTYTSNMFGNLGGLVLSGEPDATGTYENKTITPKKVNYSHKSDFEKIEENYVDPVTALCSYTKEKENIKFYSTKIDTETLKVVYEDFVVTAYDYTFYNDASRVVKSTMTDKSITLKDDVLKATFELSLTFDSLPFVEMTVSTTWNLDK